MDGGDQKWAGLGDAVGVDDFDASETAVDDVSKEPSDEPIPGIRALHPGKL